jgi:hypothetical protein
MMQSVKDKVRNRLSSKVWDQVMSRVSYPDYKEVDKHVLNRVSSKVRDQVLKQVENKVRNNITNRTTIR